MLSNPGPQGLPPESGKRNDPSICMDSLDIGGGQKRGLFKTVCEALLRRPRWVRFPSIPPTFIGRTARMNEPTTASQPRARPLMQVQPPATAIIEIVLTGRLRKA